MTARPLDPSEIYYEVVDRSWPMNAFGWLEVDGVHDAETLDRAWRDLTAQVPVMRTRLERTGPREAHFVLDDDLPPAPVRCYDSLPEALADQTHRRFDPEDAQVRCSAVVGADATTLLLTAQHAALDGRPLAQLSLLLAGLLAGEDVGDHPLTRPTEPLSAHVLPERDWSARRGEMLALARAVRDEEEYVAHGKPPAWHDPSLDRDRDVQYAVLDLTPEESAALLAWSKEAGATVQGALTVALLHTVAELTPGLTRIPFSTTVDLRARAAPSAAERVGQAAAVVMASFDVTEEPAALARRASAEVRRRVDRGEAELFVALSGVDKLPVGEASDQVVRRWMEAATPTVNLSNVGRVTGEPATVRRLGMALAPTPNQVLFAAATTFRGRASFTLAVDRNRVEIDLDTLTRTLHGCLTGLGGEAP
ncbi:hypothetical protein KUV85_16660 [Nocardioides panacisoli]|uniref:phthiocerol/phthiodiolone dimycocerosyl transferase family protein n=1 Tax=Nocardioides panacisoli TaxID=627624 RepID=UPI001C6295BE|nr:hypothetical protein [Nocardioides panacisoli]QYJ03931.1 hypothetical protein KUV85_16660 [Nocardioides panacisoli]